MSDTNPIHETEEPSASRRWLTWYPVLALLVIALVILLARSEEGDAEPEQDSPTGLVYVPPTEPSEGRAAPGESQPDPVTLQSGLMGAEGLAARAGAVAGLFGDRIGGIAANIGGRVEREKLLEHGHTAARFVPFAGPYLRYHRARRLWAVGDEADREAAKRQTVVALAELALDAGSAGLGQAAANSEGLTVALAGAVDVADFMDSALAIHELLGDPLQLESLLAATRSVDELAGLALVNVDGLDGFVVSLLALEAEDIKAQVPDWAPDLVDRLSRELDSALETVR